MGGVYMILATNLGARLGFLVALAGLAGWMLLMGIDLERSTGSVCKGKDPTWDAVPGRTVLQDVGALYTAGVFDQRLEIPPDTPFPEQAELVKQQFQAEGWTPLSESDTQFGQAASAAATFLEETKTLRRRRVQGRQRLRHRRRARSRRSATFDLFAFWHKPHYVVVEVAPLVTDAHRSRARPGGGRDRHDAPAPVRLHGPQPRHPAPTGRSS